MTNFNSAQPSFVPGTAISSILVERKISCALHGFFTERGIVAADGDKIWLGCESCQRDRLMEKMESQRYE